MGAKNNPEQEPKRKQISGTISNVLKIGLTLSYGAFFAWLFVPMCDMQKQERMYPGYSTSKVEQLKDKEKRVALIPLEGTINSAGQGVNSNVLISYIDAAVNSGVEGFIFEVDSPGGVVLPSKELGERVKMIQQPKVALIRNIGASGAYWVASACDWIIADETSMVGSIGVRMDRFDVSELMKKLGVKYDPIYAGIHKTMGTPFEKIPSDGRKILEGMVNDMHELFITSVAANREMDVEKVRGLATGRVFLGKDALELGLVDELGGRSTAANYLLGRLKSGYEFELYKQPQQKGILGVTSSLGEAVGRGLGETMLEYTIKQQ